MADVFVDKPVAESSSLAEVVAAIVLGIAAVLTAISAYQASIKDGQALQGYIDSTRTLNDANAFYSQANQKYALDQQLFVEYAAAARGGEEELAEYLTTVMRPELAAAVEWSDARDGATPFDVVEGNPYRVDEQSQAQRLEKRAARQFATSTDDGESGDQFQLATVLFALVLFFAGVANLFRPKAVKGSLLGVSLVALALGSVVMFSAT